MMIHDSARLAALERTNLLDSPPEYAFDRLTKLTNKVLRVPISLITLVDRERQFFKSVMGPEPWTNLHETPLSHSFCQHLIPTSKPLVITDARCHPLLHDNLAIPALGVIAYLGIPLTSPEGHTLGSLCAIDTQPREWTEEEIDILQELAVSAMTEVELRLTGQRLQESYEKLKEAHSRLQAVEDLRDDLVDMIVHDLRTPLTSLIYGIQLLATLGQLNQKQHDTLALLTSSGKSSLGMINDLLDISRMESESLPLEYTEVCAATLLEKAQQQVQALAMSQGQTLTSEVAPCTPSFLADEDKVVRTLVNLLGNAIKFTSGDTGINMSARFAREEQGIVFAVSDTGEGIPQEELERIFDKFGQAASRKSGRKMSSGLGLTFCKLVVEAHGGRIWVESEVGKGSSFIFLLPIVEGL
jgi:signal transduction histidine kinase